MSRLEEIRERWEKATPGPWRWSNTSGEAYLFGARTRVVMAFQRMGMNGAQPAFRGEDDILYPAGKENINGFSDAVAIAHAREDVPFLLAEVERLNQGRLCRKHYESGPDDEIHDPAGCIICVINRAEKAEAEVSEIRAVASSRGHKVETLEAEVERLNFLYGTSIPGSRCTCECVDPGDHISPPAYEQDPWCPRHPDMSYIREEFARVEAERDEVQETARRNLVVIEKILDAPMFKHVKPHIMAAIEKGEA